MAKRGLELWNRSGGFWWSVVGGNASTTTDICFSFSSALRKPFGSSLCFLANKSNGQRRPEICNKSAAQKKWLCGNFKLSWVR